MNKIQLQTNKYWNLYSLPFFLILLFLIVVFLSFYFQDIIECILGLRFSETFSLAVTTLFGIIAVVFYNKQKKQAQLLEAEVGRIGDIMRPFKDEFPQIINQIRELCEDSLKSSYSSEFYVMNRTSAFGKIHTFNPKFIKHYDINNEELKPETKSIVEDLKKKYSSFINHLSDQNEIARCLFYKDIEEISDDFKRCGQKLPKDKFKMIVFDNANLKNNFIEDYYKKVNEINDIELKKGLIFFVETKSINTNNKIGYPITFSSCMDNKSKIENEITNTVTHKHNDLINSIKSTRIDNWLKESTDIPMQMYLLKRKINGQIEYHTFIINAMNTEHNGNKDRYIDGLYSKEKSLYSVFKTLFDETFNKQ